MDLSALRSATLLIYITRHCITPLNYITILHYTTPHCTFSTSSGLRCRMCWSPHNSRPLTSCLLNSSLLILTRLCITLPHPLLPAPHRTSPNNIKLNATYSFNPTLNISVFDDNYQLLLYDTLPCSVFLSSIIMRVFMVRLRTTSS